MYVKLWYHKSPAQSCGWAMSTGSQSLRAGRLSADLTTESSPPSPSRLPQNHSRWIGHKLFLKYLAVRTFLISSGKFRTAPGSSSYFVPTSLSQSCHSQRGKGRLIIGVYIHILCTQFLNFQRLLLNDSLYIFIQS